MPAPIELAQQCPLVVTQLVHVAGQRDGTALGSVAQGIVPAAAERRHIQPVVLDAGALIAIERADRRVVRLLELADQVHVPSAVLAQVWRNPARQVRLVRVLTAEPVTIAPLDGDEARAVGQVCGATGTSDFADASVAVLARRVAGVVVTSDPNDLRRIDPGLDLALC